MKSPGEIADGTSEQWDSAILRAHAAKHPQASALILTLYKRLKIPPWRIAASYLNSTDGLDAAIAQGWLREDWTGTIHLTPEGIALAKEMTS